MTQQYVIHLFNEPSKPGGVELVFPAVDWNCEPELIKLTDSHILVHLRSRSCWSGIGLRTKIEAEYVLFKRGSPQPRGTREIVELQERVIAGKRSALVKQELITKMGGN